MSRRAADSVTGRLLAPGVLAGLSNLELVARTVVDGSLTGLHRSPRFGFSQEFAEYRAYTPGDDLRFIDWNVFARTERMVIKRFFGDTNTRLMVLLDASASMGLLEKPRTRRSLPGGRGGAVDVSKLDYARFLAAALFYLAARQHDAAGILVFDEAVRAYRPPTARALGIRRLYHLLDSLAAKGATNWQDALRQVGAQIRKKSLLVLISDCYTDPQTFGKGLRDLGVQGHDLLVVQVLSPAELQIDAAAGTSFRDIESGRVMDVSSDDLARGYPARLAHHVESLRQQTLAAGAHFLQVQTDQPLETTLIPYLHFRARHP